ncbi:hypothetical protein K2X14_10235 [Acetobacter sp. TBRC 12305]|uniref:Cyanophage baseplate Pam3 plug gp18 domain-containing protein n=1 Tax=Acetobacter garciniae TaxID=2817435 RepID=A0A939HKD8_9PROT|nr:hypothetical protein [Acetobacter garciniae]MBO1326045.1 hypothetical protein [Acetobacter garciniae]MBX0345211.1 hypothetical protein [Acetobacter garciniae]
MAQLVPLSPVAAQSVQVPLSGHMVQIDLRQNSTGLYMTLTLDGTMLLAGVLCQDRTWLVRKSYFGLPGDFAFCDMQGISDPSYTELGSRFVLVYAPGVHTQVQGGDGGQNV